MTSLKDRVFACIQKPKSIPQICKELKIDDEYKIMHALADLEDENKAILSGFDRFYEPDGCAGYLAKYEAKVIS